MNICNKSTAKLTWKKICKQYKNNKREDHPFYYWTHKLCFILALITLFICLSFEFIATITHEQEIDSTLGITILISFGTASIFSLVMWLTDVFPKKDKYDRWINAFKKELGNNPSDKDVFLTYIQLKKFFKPNVGAKWISWLIRTLSMIMMAIFIADPIDVLTDKDETNTIWKFMVVIFIIFMNWLLTKIVNLIARQFTQDDDYESMKKIVEIKLMKSIIEQ